MNLNCEAPRKRKELPQGTWVKFTGLSVETTEEDVQRFIIERTGCEIPLKNIDMMVARDGVRRINGALVSFQKIHFEQVMQWAFGEDIWQGRRPNVHVMKSAREQL